MAPRQSTPMMCALGESLGRVTDSPKLKASPSLAIMRYVTVSTEAEWTGDSVTTSQGGISEGLPQAVPSGDTASYEIGVAISPLEAAAGTNNRPAGGGIPGFDETMGRGQPRWRSAVVERGEEAVQAATEALASQIGLAAHRIAAAIEVQSGPASDDASLGLESVQVAFGITLSTGLQAMFTALVDSSAQVTVTISRRPG